MTIQKKTTATSSTNNGVYPKNERCWNCGRKVKKLHKMGGTVCPKCGDKGGAKWKI
jgi:predicted RNA-binding Zn-ribbon protein involved in translation (DUF1610 family)